MFWYNMIYYSLSHLLALPSSVHVQKTRYSKVRINFPTTSLLFLWGCGDLPL